MMKTLCCFFFCRILSLLRRGHREKKNDGWWWKPETSRAEVLRIILGTSVENSGRKPRVRRKIPRRMLALEHWVGETSEKLCAFWLEEEEYDNDGI